MTGMPAGRITRISGTAVAIRGDDLDTDRIMPARFLRALTFEGLGDHVFEDDRAASAAHGRLHPFDDPRCSAASILVVNRNFGCGSSREHAPQGLLRRGIRALVGESFSEIFFGNVTMLGMPCVMADHDAIAALMDTVERQPDIAATIDLDAMTIQAGSRSTSIGLPAAVREAFLDGTWDGTGLLLERFVEVERVAERLPYISGFRSQD